MVKNISTLLMMANINTGQIYMYKQTSLSSYTIRSFIKKKYITYIYTIFKTYLWYCAPSGPMTSWTTSAPKSTHIPRAFWKVAFCGVKKNVLKMQLSVGSTKNGCFKVNLKTFSRIIF